MTSDVKLDGKGYIDKHLKRVKVRGINSSLDLAEESARVNGSFEVAGSKGIQISSGSDELILTSNDRVVLSTYEPRGHVIFNSAIGIVEGEVTFDATDTICDFTGGLNQELTLTGDVTDLHFRFPLYSCKCTCIILQDGIGGRNVTSFKSMAHDGTAAFNGGGGANIGKIRWAGGTAPSLTETANKADIITFHWSMVKDSNDVPVEKPYGVFSENF